MRLIYHPDAELELIDAARFYEGRVRGLGEQFLATVDEGVSMIQAAPERFRIVERDVRRLILRRFPYSVLYRIGPGQIRVLGINHQSRHPDYWRYRHSE